MARPSSAELVRMLEPWLVRARLCLEPFFTDAFGLGGEELWWVQWLVPTDGGLTVEDVEAMELLELLARVDFHAAWKTMLEITKETVYLDQVVDAAPAMDDPKAVCARFQISGLCHTTTNSTIQDALRLLLIEIDAEDHSPTYYTIRETLLQCCADEGSAGPFVRGDSQRIQFLLEIDLGKQCERDATSVMDAVTTAASLTSRPERLELYASWQAPRGGRACALSSVFKLHAVNIHFDDSTVTDSMLVSAQSIWEDTEVEINWIDVDPAADKLSPPVVTEFLRSMLTGEAKTNGSVPTLLSTSTGASRVNNPPSGETLDDFAGLCSALAVSPDLNYACVDYVTGDSRLYWAWVAYALFSCDATHKISRLRVSAVELTQECVDVFKRVLSAHDPLAVLWRYHNDEYEYAPNDAAPGLRSVVELKPRSVLVLTKERGKLRTGNRIETLVVVEDRPEKHHICVLYAGAGMCWVHRSEIIGRSELAPLSLSGSTITELCVDIYSDTDVDALIVLLTSIGSSQLEKLVLFGTHAKFFADTFFARLLQAFPRLQRLDLASIEVETLDWLESCGSKLTSMSLLTVEPRARGSYRRYLASIASDSSALVRLHLELPTRELASLTADMERVLRENRLMECLFLTGVDEDETDGKLVEELKQRLQEHSGTLLATQRAPLSLKCKLAFLSIFCGSQVSSSADAHTHTQLPAMDKLGGPRTMLDIETIVLIFEFAAPCKRRVCGFISPVSGGL